MPNKGRKKKSPSVKVRRQWGFNPKSRVHEGIEKYDRARAKKEYRRNEADA